MRTFFVPSMQLVLALAVLLHVDIRVNAYTPWPQPVTQSVGTSTISVSSSLSFSLSSGASPGNLLSEGFSRYAAAITKGYACSESRQAMLAKANERRGQAQSKSHGLNAASTLSECIVSVLADEEPPLAEDTDESYSLSLSEDGTCAIEAATGYGVLRALETLSHFAGEACTIENAPLKVADAPRFSYRGLMIDSSRHFLPVAFIEHVVDTMVALKLNVLHWHISDSQAFPGGSKTYPELAEKGAYLYPEAAYGVEDFKALVEYARLRGVRVMPEWDIPGHGSWGYGVPQIMVSDGPCTDTLDPTKQETYDFLGAFLGEMVTIFPDMFLFLGGDEVQTYCFTESPSVSAWMEANDVADGVALQSYFWQQVTTQVMPALNRTLGVWMADDGIPYPEDLPVGSFGNVWQSQSMTAPVIDRGAKVVLSGPWYLDQQRPGGYEVYALQQMWQGMYAVEPYDNLTAAQQEMVLGGQACMWGEGINTGDFDAYAVTKAAAVAERLWSARDVADKTAAEPRLIEHVCRLNMRGIAAEPIEPSFCLTDVL